MGPGDRAGGDISPVVGGATLTRWTETVSFDGDAASRAAAAISSGAGVGQLPRAASSSAGASDSRKLACWQPKLSPNVASSEWSV